jgi:hypothetical protein
MLDRLISVLVAVSLAFLVWLYLRSRDQEMLDSVPVPVHIALASGQEDHYDLEVAGPGQIPVSFTGPPSRIRELRGLMQHGELGVEVTICVPPDRLDDSRYLETVCIEAGDIHPPPGVTPIVVEGRNRIPVVLHRLVERRLPVRLEHTEDKEIAQVLIEPGSVLVRGPQDILDNVRSIPTQLYVLPPHPEKEAVPGAINAATMTADSVRLVQELDGRRIRTIPRVVTVRIAFRPRQSLYHVEDVPIHFLCPPNFSLKPFFAAESADKITLRLLGPAGQAPPPVIAFVDLSGRKWEPGSYEEPVRVQLPGDFQLAPGARPVAAFHLQTAALEAKGQDNIPEP